MHAFAILNLKKCFGGKSGPGGTRMRNQIHPVWAFNTEFVASFGGKSGWHTR